MSIRLLFFIFYSPPYCLAILYLFPLFYLYFLYPFFFDIPFHFSHFLISWAMLSFSVDSFHGFFITAFTPPPYARPSSSSLGTLLGDSPEALTLSTPPGALCGTSWPRMSSTGSIAPLDFWHSFMASREKDEDVMALGGPRMAHRD